MKNWLVLSLLFPFSASAETYSGFRVTAAAAASPNLVVLTDLRVSYAGSERGPLRTEFRQPTGVDIKPAEDVICHQFGAGEAVNFEAGEALLHVPLALVVSLKGQDLAYDWVSSQGSMLVTEIDCEN